MVKIVIVEDLEEVRVAMQQYLNEVVDFECKYTYPDSEQGLGGILINRPEVVLMDIGLPGMSGIECMLRVKRKNPQIKFLMFTVFEDDEHVFESLKYGADGYILKRETMKSIEGHIRILLNNGAPMSSSIALKVLRSFHEIPKTNDKIQVLSSRQEEILENLSTGMPYKLIASKFDITIGTVKQHVHQIYKKLQVNNKTEAINKYFGNRR